MTRVVYLVGYPGAGKSTAVKEALRWLRRTAEPRTDPVPHVRFGDVWHLGPLDRPGGFDGTDGLSMSIQPRVVDWLGDAEVMAGCRVLLAEGDRLANASFLDAVREAGHHLVLAHLDAPVDVAQQRAADRAVRLHRAIQTFTWWKGRVTKVDNLTGSRPTVHIDARLPPDQVGHALFRQLIDA